MILNQKDDVAPQLAELELLLKTPGLRKDQREDIENELWMVRAGAKGEAEAAYHINFGWKDGKNSAVIHDLRIDHNGRVAQIDHLIIMRTLDFHVIESKGFGTEVRISEAGEWETRTRFGWRGIPSPIEQNRRHVEVLRSFIEDNGLVPNKLGISIPLNFHNWVLVSPHCQIRRTGAEGDRVVKMDMFEKRFEQWMDKKGVLDVLASMSKLVSTETVEQLAQALLAAHKPATFNFAAKFGIQPVEVNDDSRFAPPDPAAVKCESCSTILEPKVVNFCRLNSKRFGGRKFCQKCQKIPAKPGCDVCGVELEDKVIAFCRFNSKRIGGKKVCRTCQGASILS
jgi:Nuclease-related domain